MTELVPTQVKAVKIEKDYGKFVMEPLLQGYGTTIGNSLRRVLLSSLRGAAIVGVKIEGILHEFSTIAGIKEDVTNIILNLKEVSLKLTDLTEVELRREANKAGVVTAGDIECPEGVEILNPEHPICTIEDGAIEMKLFAMKDKGYREAKNQNINNNTVDTLGLIAIDSIFSPIKRVNYTVNNTRLGNVTDYDKLELEVWTDGSITPEEAVSRSATELIRHLDFFKQMSNSEEEPTTTLRDGKDPDGKEPSVLEKHIEDLDLTVRSYNCLKRAGINTVGDLIAMTEEELIKVRNLGKKSLEEIKQKVDDLGLEFANTKEGE